MHNVYLQGDRAYLAHSASRGLTVVDLSDPERPVISLRGCTTACLLNQELSTTSLISEWQVATQVTSSDVLPDEVELLQNYPNPFNAQTSIPFRLDESARVELRVVDLLGQTVEILVNEVFAAVTIPFIGMP